MSDYTTIRIKKLKHRQLAKIARETHTSMETLLDIAISRVSNLSPIDIDVIKKMQAEAYTKAIDKLSQDPLPRTFATGGIIKPRTKKTQVAESVVESDKEYDIEDLLAGDELI